MPGYIDPDYWPSDYVDDVTGYKGRAVRITRNGILVAGARVKSVKVDGSLIDVTSDDEDAVRQLLEQPGEIGLTIGVSGIIASDLLLQEALRADDRTQTVVFGISGAQLSGSFSLLSFEIGTHYQQGTTFNAEFQSAGVITRT